MDRVLEKDLSHEGPQTLSHWKAGEVLGAASTKCESTLDAQGGQCVGRWDLGLGFKGEVQARERDSGGTWETARGFLGRGCQERSRDRRSQGAGGGSDSDQQGPVK